MFSQVTLRCKARGTPRPFITWFFDGSEIPHLKGRFMVSEAIGFTILKSILTKLVQCYYCHVFSSTKSDKNRSLPMAPS